MWQIITIIGSVVVLLVLIELLNLPDWIGRKMRGIPTIDALNSRIESLETRLADLEKKL